LSFGKKRKGEGEEKKEGGDTRTGVIKSDGF